MRKIVISPKKGKQGVGAGVWNLGPGRDSFGGPTRPEIPVLDRLLLLAKAGITYVEAHDVEIAAGDVPRTKKLLKRHGFLRVHVASGRRAAVAMSIPAERFRHWNAAQKQYVVAPGDYQLLIGAASDDIRLMAPLKVAAVASVK